MKKYLLISLTFCFFASSFVIGEVITLTSIEDTTLRNSYPDTNYGADPNARIGRDLYNSEMQVMVVQFDLASLPAISPDDVEEATLKLRLVDDAYTYPPSAVPWLVEAYRVMPDRDWVEIEATANEYKSGSAWTQQCGLGLGTDISVNYYDRMRADDLLKGDLLVFDITDIVKEWLSGITNNGVSLKFATSGPEPTNVAVKVGALGNPAESNRPVLEIVHTWSEPNTCAEAISRGFGLAGDMDEDCRATLADFAIIAEEWFFCNDPEQIGSDPACQANW